MRTRRGFRAGSTVFWVAWRGRRWDVAFGRVIVRRNGVLTIQQRDTPRAWPLERHVSECYAARASAARAARERTWRYATSAQRRAK